MSGPLRVLCIFGTRPEAIKMAPVVARLRARDGVECRVCVTAQHRELLDQVLEVFALVPDYDLDLMRSDQRPIEVAAAVLAGLAPVLREFRPERVLVHGDTTSTLAAAIGAFYERIPVAHIEAGLRTGDLGAPWPEELNRRVTAQAADLHFAPTEGARRNLLAEGVADPAIVVTGNTVIDAVQSVCTRLDEEPGLAQRTASALPALDPARRLLLVTGHRRENMGARFNAICDAVAELAARPDVEVVFAVHPNPNVRGPVAELLGGHPNVRLIDPPGYLPFVALLRRAELILSDSGGIQEEAAALAKPVLVTRDATERPEGIAAGVIRLVGADRGRIVAEAAAWLDGKAAPVDPGAAARAYGDGHAARRIVAALLATHGRQQRG